MDKVVSQKEYQSMLFTQFMLHGKSANEAMILAKEAVDKINRDELPFINIHVG